MRRRGAGLIIALTVIMMVGTTVSLLTLQVGAMYRQRRHEQARTHARVLLDSGIAYVEAHRDQLTQKSPSEIIVLPTEQLLSSSATAGLTLERLDNNTAIRIHAWAGTGPFRVNAVRTLPLPPYHTDAAKRN